MSRFQPRHMAGRPIDSANYALGVRLGTDLSLVTGPCPWGDLISNCLSGCGDQDLRQYRSPAQDPRLVEAIARREGLVPASIWLVPGADTAIEFVLGRFLVAGARIGILAPNFPRFAIVAATLADVAVEHFDSIDAVPLGLAMAVLCTPCNPTTCELAEADVRRALASRPDTLFCIDAVFSWYGSWNPSDLCRDFENVIVLKSYSKIGLAGLRLGYVVASPDLIAEVRTGRSPFGVNALSQSVGLAVEQSLDRLDEIHAWIRTRMVELEAGFGRRLTHATPVPFYTLQVNGDSTTAARLLGERGVFVVDCAKFVGMPANRLRIAVGSLAENEVLLKAFAELGLIA